MRAKKSIKDKAPVLTDALLPCYAEDSAKQRKKYERKRCLDSSNRNANESKTEEKLRSHEKLLNQRDAFPFFLSAI